MPRSAGLLITLVASALAVAGWLEVFRLKSEQARAPQAAVASPPGAGWTELVEGLSDDQSELFRLQEQVDLLTKENTRLTALTRRQEQTGTVPAVPEPESEPELAPGALEANKTAPPADTPVP